MAKYVQIFQCMVECMECVLLPLFKIHTTNHDSWSYIIQNTPLQGLPIRGPRSDFIEGI